MHRNYLTFLPFALCIALMSSCEVPVEIDGDSQIVVQSYFTDDDNDLVVNVTESSNRSGTSEIIYVENATVTLFNGDDFEFVTSLELTQAGAKFYYKTVDFKPVVGKEYLLNVEVPGYKPITAVNTIPPRVNLTADDTEIGNSVHTNETGISVIDFDVTVKVNDPIATQNFYHILFKQELVQQWEEDGYWIYDTTYLDDKNLNVEAAGMGAKNLELEQVFKEPSFLLSDEGFNGNQLILSFQGDFTYDESKYERGDFVVEMRTVSYDYYQHFLNIAAQPSGDPLNGTEIFYDNINNGVGIFAGYTTSISRLKLPN